MFEKYNFYLSDVVEFDNYWSDFGIFDAINVMNEFSNEDWNDLRNELMKKEPIWIISCSETLSEIKNKAKAFEILEQMLGHFDGNVILSAIDSINAMISTRSDYPGEILNLLNVLNEKIKGASGIELMVMNSLRQKIIK